MSVRVVRNPAFKTELREDPDFQQGMRDITDIAAASVREVAEGFRHTGYYLRRVKAKGTRVVAQDPFWHLVEFGSKNNPAYAPLRLGVRGAGLRLEETERPA